MHASDGANEASASAPAMHDQGHGPSPTTAAFARKLAHDLNNFATVVRTYSELLLADLPVGAAREDVTEIHRAADAMVAYLQRVARFARTSGLRPSPRHLLPIVNDIVVEFAADASTAFPRVMLGETVESMVDVDPSWLRDVVRELVVNAREAAPASSAVIVATREHETGDGQRWAIVEVCDEGPGFAASIVHQAEEPFVSTKDGVRGAGFGLTLAAAFADASGGRLVRVRDANITRVAIWLRVHE